ncbi:hypothetical protein [Bradyrhizobium sp. AC87j1]|uniref:hypothetical protein n=1 Tax=Bradyrhizobium sp. AC87j1 TaxID=2055894 RepID=UPI0011B07999|nr:hypothetical protein [Bradyrhizobium sp. AC87j1]
MLSLLLWEQSLLPVRQRVGIIDRLRILGRLAFEKLTSARVRGARLSVSFPTHALRRNEKDLPEGDCEPAGIMIRRRSWRHLHSE